MDSKKMLPEETIDEFINDFMEDLKQSFVKNYANFNTNNTENLTKISLELKNTLESFPFFDGRDDKEVLECEQLVCTLNIIAAKTNSTITVMANEQENTVCVGIREKSICIDGELLQLFVLATQICHSITVFCSGMYFIYKFDC